MEIMTGGLYFVSDEFFAKIQDPYLKINYENTKRPHYFAFRDSITGLYWLVPCSSKIEKFERLVQNKREQHKPTDTIKIAVDIAMTAVLLLLMTYELIGQVSHELLGIIMFVLFILHHILNSRWIKNLIRGEYTALRTLQTVLVVSVLLSMAGSIFSGVVLSRYRFSFLPFGNGLSFARNMHMLSAYWGFVFMSLHLGFHWNMMMGMAKRLTKKSSAMRTWMLRIIDLIIAGYGVYAFVKRDIGSYLLIQNQFAFFDFEEPIVQFLLDYIAVLGLFTAIGHYTFGIIRKLY